MKSKNPIEEIFKTAKKNGIVYSDRYSALGIKCPSKDTICKGQCEGTGYIPVTKNDQSPKLRALWRKAELAHKSDDGFHFVKCSTCGGTGRRKTTKK